MNEKQAELLVNQFEETLKETKGLHQQMDGLTKTFTTFHTKLSDVNQMLQVVMAQLEDTAVKNELNQNLTLLEQVKSEANNLISASQECKMLQNQLEEQQLKLQSEIKESILTECQLIRTQLCDDVRKELLQLMNESRQQSQHNYENLEDEITRIYQVYRDNELKVPFKKLVKSCLAYDGYYQSISKLIYPVKGIKQEDYLEKCWDKIYDQETIGQQFFEVTYQYLKEHQQLKRLEQHFV